MKKNSTHFLLSLCMLLLWACSGSKDQQKQETKTEETAQQAAGYVRRNAHSAEASADLAAYDKAMAQMKKLDCSNPVSWYYQGAMHNLPDYKTYLSKGDFLCPAYKDTLFPGWASCPHMKPELVQYHFLTWHRLYLYYFEKIIRQMSGKKDFALPYWDYNNRAQRTLPMPFYNPADSVSNALYDIERSPYLLAGNSIDTVSTDAIVMNVQILGKDTIVVVEPQVAMAAILDTSYLWTASDIHHFSYELEDVIHNCIHDYVGGTVNPFDTASLAGIYNRIYQASSKAVGGALMGDVPSSAFDPIFFLHHANIDRLWAEWEMDHPDLALTLQEYEKAGWGQVNYIFFDENGKEVKYTSLQQVYDSVRSVNYTYDGLGKPMLLKATKPSISKLKNTYGNLAATKKLTGAPVVFTVPVDGGLSKSQDEKTFFTLEVETSFAKRPHSRMEVFLIGNPPKKGERADIKNYLVGLVGFFGASHAEGVAAHHHHEKGVPNRKIIKLDITDELKRQKALDKKQLKVVLNLDRPDKGNPITIDKVTIKSYTLE